MCGIAGVVSLDGRPVKRAPVDQMVRALAHRGPDGQGTFVNGPIGLGHGRLSILDPTPAGAQPMVRDGAILIHNGEVYNYLELTEELRALGAQITSGTDTEMILAAYREWGIEAIPRFNGMFAFALWDTARRRLVLARDRMGVKPLYMRQTARSLVFASEPQAIVVGRPVDESDAWTPEPHLGTVYDFLSRGATDHTSQTFFDGITALEPGHLMVIEEGTQRTRRYWGPPALADDVRPVVTGLDRDRDAQLVAEFRAVFDSSNRLRLRSDVPIGTCLSGGLDSSSIVTTVAELRAADPLGRGNEQVPRLAFHARFPADGIDESAYAEAVASLSGVRLVHRTPTGHPLLGAIIPVLRAQGEPYGGASINAQYAVMGAAHDDRLKVLLDGQGADELLGGYHQYLGVRSAGLLRAGNVGGSLHELRGQVSQQALAPGPAMVMALRGVLPRRVLEAVRATSGGRLGVRTGQALLGHQSQTHRADPPGTMLSRRLWRALESDSLPALLRYEDRNSMAFGVEARVPFLDVRLIELVARLPDRLRINRGVTKVILRKAMAGRVPDAIIDRRDKLGFAAPQGAWLARGRHEVVAVLRDGQVSRRGWVDGHHLEDLLARDFMSRRVGDQTWRLLVTEMWLRLWWPDPTVAGQDTWAAALASAQAPGASSPS